MKRADKNALCARGRFRVLRSAWVDSGLSYSPRAGRTYSVVRRTGSGLYEVAPRKRKGIGAPVFAVAFHYLVALNTEARAFLVEEALRP